MAQATSTLREIRTQLGLSQAECAAALGVAVETFRTWDAGRRPAPGALIERARALKTKSQTDDRVPLRILADEFRVKAGPESEAVGREGRCGEQGGGLPVGKRQAKAVGSVLASDRTAAALRSSLVRSPILT